MAVSTAHFTSGSGTQARATRLQLFASGVLAALVMVVFMLALRGVTETDSLVELVGEAVLQAMPMGVFSFLLHTLEESAKPLLVASVVLALLLAGGGIAQLDGGAASSMPVGRRIGRMVLLVVAIWVPAAIFAVVVQAWGTAVPLTNDGLLAVATILLLDVVVFVVSLYLLYPLVRSATGRQSTRVDVDVPPADLGRRRVVSLLATGAIALAGTVYVGRFARQIRGGAIGGGGDTLSPPVTPNDDFYLISKNFVDPRVDEDDWRLTISGLVDAPKTLAYVDLLAIPSQRQLATLTCISNEVGGDLISNAAWTGVPLADLLALAGVRPEASEVVLFAADGYSESFPLSKALEPATMLVYLMNDEPLPSRHGFPARLIVPGKYGIKNVKWLEEIELRSGDFKGYWQQRGWTDEATIHTMARFDVPGARAIVPRAPVEIGGVAFAGDRGIARVEYTDDDGATWRAVDALERVAPLSWVIWRSTWNPPRSGAFTLKVRAIDGTGAVQTEERRKPIPDGATGYHTIDIGVT
jgi:hypothetical protein